MVDQTVVGCSLTIFSGVLRHSNNARLNSSMSKLPSDVVINTSDFIEAFTRLRHGR